MEEDSTANLSKELAMITTVLLVAALIMFLIGLLEHPTISATRCLCLGLALLTLAMILSGR